MDTVFQRPTGVTMDPKGDFGIVKYGSDKMNVMFYMKAVLDPELTKEQGTPFYTNKIYVRIHPPGEMLNIVDRPIMEADKFNYALQWQQYSLNKTQVPEGTPVDILFPNYPAIAATLKGMGVYTIQQLAKLSGNSVDGLGMGGQEYVNKAIKFLEEANSSKDYINLQQELNKRDEELKSLNRQFAMQAKTIQELQSKLQSLGPIDRSQQHLGHVATEDTQTLRINSTHPTREIKKPKKVDLSQIEDI